MADVTHVKPKSAWKKVELDKSFFSGVDFAGPAYIDVLEDYEISTFKPRSKKLKESLNKKDKNNSDKDKKKLEKNNKKKKQTSNKAKTDVDKEDEIKSKERVTYDKKVQKKKETSQKLEKNVKKDISDNVKKKPQKKKVHDGKSDIDVAKPDKNDDIQIAVETGLSSDKKSKKRKLKTDDEGSSPKKKKKTSKDSVKNNKDKAGSDDAGKMTWEQKQIYLAKHKERLQNDIAPGMEGWNGMHVPNEVLWALQERGFTTPTEIQTRTLPSAIRDKMDIVGAAETGSGKTLAFGIPVVNYILQKKKVTNNKLETEETEDAELDSDIEEDFSENNEEDVSDKEDNDLEELIEESSLKNMVDTGSDDMDGGGEASDNDEEEDDNDDVEDDDDDLEDEDPEGSGSESLGEEEMELPEDGLGCVRVVKDVDFSWIEKEEQEARVNSRTHPYALILEPTRELAIQVKNHITAIAKYTDITIATIVGGMSIQKQRRVLKQCPDIIVATPGRLWDLLGAGEHYLSEIEKTGHLVIDEADRMVEKGHFEELASLLRKMNIDPKICAKRHTYVFSATLTTVHEGPQRFDKRRKNKITKLTETHKLELLMESIGLKAKPKVVDLTRKVGTVETLTEARIHCSNEEKDIHLYYFLKQYPGRTLVFCNSKDCIRRLVSIFTYLKCNPLPLHADMHQRQRLKNLDRFTSNPKGVLIASDVAARGLDIPNIQHVIHFQVPQIVENYIHRSGRTARASKQGLSVMFIGPNDMKNYKKIVNTLNRDEDLPLFPIEPAYLAEVKVRVDLVRKIETQEYRFQKGKRQNDWFQKMADESGIEIDDQNLLADIGGEKGQADHKRTMKHLKLELERLLKQPIVPREGSGKYPTKMGKLVIPVDKSETGGAIAHLKIDKKKQDKVLQRLKNKPPPEKPQKPRKDKWKKKKKNRMMVKKDA